MQTIEEPNDALRKHLLSNIQPVLFDLARNLSLAAGGICLAVILTLAQTNPSGRAAEICLYSSSIALPLWILSAAISEYFILYGEKFYSVYSDVEPWIMMCMGIGGPLLALSVGSAIYIISPIASYGYVISVLGCIVIMVKVNNIFGRAVNTLKNSDATVRLDIHNTESQ